MQSHGNQSNYSPATDLAALDGDVLLTGADVAAILNIRPLTLRNWRSSARPVNFATPRYIKIGGGRAVRYRVADVRDYLAGLNGPRSEHAA